MLRFRKKLYLFPSSKTAGSFAFNKKKRRKTFENKKVYAC